MKPETRTQDTQTEEMGVSQELHQTIRQKDEEIALLLRELRHRDIALAELKITLGEDLQSLTQQLAEEQEAHRRTELSLSEVKAELYEEIAVLKQLQGGGGTPNSLQPHHSPRSSFSGMSAVSTPSEDNISLVVPDLSPVPVQPSPTLRAIMSSSPVFRQSSRDYLSHQDTLTVPIPTHPAKR